MRSWMPYTIARLRVVHENVTDQDTRAAFNHADAVLALVATLVNSTSEDGHTDPRAVHSFLTDLYVTLSGREPNTMRTVLPLDEWDRHCESLFPETGPARASSLSLLDS